MVLAYENPLPRLPRLFVLDTLLLVLLRPATGVRLDEPVAAASRSQSTMRTHEPSAAAILPWRLTGNHYRVRSWWLCAQALRKRGVALKPRSYPLLPEEERLVDFSILRGVLLQ